MNSTRSVAPSSRLILKSSTETRTPKFIYGDMVFFLVNGDVCNKSAKSRIDASEMRFLTRLAEIKTIAKEGRLTIRTGHYNHTGTVLSPEPWNVN